MIDAETILKTLLQYPTESDRGISKRVHVSQPTISRHRAQLEREGIVRYIAIPNLKSVGYGLIAIGTMSPIDGFKTVAKEKQVIFAVPTGIIDNTLFTVSIHKDYDDFLAFQGKYSFDMMQLISTSIKPIKQLSLADIDITLP